MFLKFTKIFSLILNSLLGLCVTVDEGYETEESLALKFVCRNFANFIYLFSRKREIVDYF